MQAKKIKEISIYALILAAGLGCGYVAMKVPAWLKSPYTEGNYAAYFPDAKTKVVVYGTSTCKFCIMTRDYLRANNIQFADMNVETDEKAKRQLMELGGSAVPVILIGDRRINGFNKPVVEAALAKVTRQGS